MGNIYTKRISAFQEKQDYRYIGISPSVYYYRRRLIGPFSHLNSSGKSIFATVTELTNGMRHNKKKPAVQWDNGDEEWWYLDKLHRVDGPAIYYNNGEFREYWCHGKLHREDGPAIIGGDSYFWFWNGEPVSFLEWYRLTPINNEELALMKLIYA